MSDAPATHPSSATSHTERPATARRRVMALVAVAFVGGSLLSGAGAVWAGHQFSDVPDSNPFHADIDWMVDNGIADGYADGTYRPTNPVSRQAFAAFLHRYNDRTDIVQTTSNPPSGQLWAFTASCDPGRRAIGGGGKGVANMAVIASYPSSTTTWRVDFQSIAGEIDPATATVYALCAPA